MKMKREPDYTVVSDFRANGATRGAIDPVLDLAGEVLRPRNPDDKPTDTPPVNIPQSTYRRYSDAVRAARRDEAQILANEHQAREETRRAIRRRRVDLLSSYAWRRDKPGHGEFVAAGP